MTVNYSFNLEDDDFLDDTFRSITENDLLSYNISSPAFENPLNNALNDLQTPCTSGVIERSSVNTVISESNRKNSVSFLLDNKEISSAKPKEVENMPTRSLNKFKAIDETSEINSRFVPGFTPKAKKRKLPGLDDFLSEINDLQFHPVGPKHFVTKGTSTIIETKDIINSQFSSEDLLLPSWRNLQSEVSSQQNLLSTAKYYSIQRVLHETSKLKLPKHLVVPVLCVQIKKYNAEESSLVLMDDTGKISGKIDKEVINLYNDVIRERTALILTKVTCICNILCIQKQNLVSIFLEDGTVKRIQDFNCILNEEESLKPMNCLCPGTPNEQTVKTPLFSKDSNSTPISSKKAFTTNHKMTKNIGSSSYSIPKGNCKAKCIDSFCAQEPIEKDKVLNILDAMIDVSKDNCNPGNSMLTDSFNPTSGETLKPIASRAFNKLSFSTEVSEQDLASKTLNEKKNYSNETLTNPSFPESMLEEDLFFEHADDFDEILCSLDEKSFLQET